MRKPWDIMHRHVHKAIGAPLNTEWTNFYHLMEYDHPLGDGSTHSTLCDCDLWRGQIQETKIGAIRTPSEIIIEFMVDGTGFKLKIDKTGDLTMSAEDINGSINELADEAVKEFIDKITDIFGVESFFIQEEVTV